MKKLTGKISSKRRNYLSFMLVPHRQGSVRTIRINNYRTTLLSITAFMLVSLLILTGYTLSVVQQNKLLKAQHEEEIERIMSEKAKLEEFISSQTKQLIENSQLISEAVSTKAISDQTVDQFKKEYEEMVVSYIDKNMAEIKSVSRGASKEKTFKESLADLRALIDLLEKAKLKEDDVNSQIAKKSVELNNYLDSLPTYWPIDSMSAPTSGFEMRFHPIYKKNLHHDGIDIGEKSGSPIYAAGSGKVILAGYNGGYGRCIIIDHGNGFKTLYGHLSSCSVKEGDWVKKGQQIGKMGNTGNSTGPHLHFEVRINDVAVDPLQFLEKR